MNIIGIICQQKFKRSNQRRNQKMNNLQQGWQGMTVCRGEVQQSRQGDWICVQCNNLNFSFRKMCNRCKVQSREDNEEQIRQAYVYYEQYYKQMEQPETLMSQNSEDGAAIYGMSWGEQVFGTQGELIGGFEDQQQSLQLPSVSPITRRYKGEKYTPKTQISQGWSSDQQSTDSFKEEYLSEYCWRNILREDQQQESDQSQSDDESFDDGEIERLVRNIVL